MKRPSRPPDLRSLSDQFLIQYASASTQPGFTDSTMARRVREAAVQDWNWDDARHRSSSRPEAELLWLAIKLERTLARQATTLADEAGAPFTWRSTPTTLRLLRQIDLRLSGFLGGPRMDLGRDEERRRYLISSLTEEAIASSQIEGAVTTRVDAKEMIRTNRAPRTVDERMILNNYRAMQRLKEWASQPLSKALLLELQTTLTQGTLQKPDQVGRFRLPTENVCVWDDEDQQVLFTPPNAEFLEKRLARLFDFANAAERDDDPVFMHPVVKAAILHFWLAYEHPFVDGNGRTARALFYWSMLRSGYWLVECLAISTIIRGHPHQYTGAYQNVQTDDNDLTYFVNYHLRVVVRAIEEFDRYVARKRTERNKLATIAGPATFNKRQQALLAKALDDHTAAFSYESHAASHGVGLMTARRDLLELERLGLLVGNRAGRRFEFIAADRLSEKLAALKNS